MKQLLLKNGITKLAILVLMVLVSISCESPITDNVIEKELKNANPDLLDKNNSNSTCNSLFDDITVEDGKLKFINLDHYRGVLECLEAQVEVHNDAFETANSNMTPEQMDNHAEQIGFNEWQPLLDFEANFNFSSRRTIFEDELTSWLDNEILDPNSDPNLDGLYPVERSLLNSNGDLIIGGQVYNRINKIDRFDCYRIKYSVEYYPYNNGNKQFVIRAGARSYPMLFDAGAALYHYKKRNSGNGWILSREKLKVQILGSARDADCNFPNSFGKINGTKTRSVLTTNYFNWLPPTWVKYKNNEVAGYATVTSAQIPGAAILN